MMATANHIEDLLLDYAYGELSDAQSREVKAHLDGCAQCTGALADIQGVRQVMSNLPEQSAPQAGLESLLAYAEQAARRVQAGPPPKRAWWKAWIVPLGGIATVAVIFVAGQTVVEHEAPGAAAEQAVQAALTSQKGSAAPMNSVAYAEERLPPAPPPPVAQVAEPEGKGTRIEAPRRDEMARVKTPEKKKASRARQAADTFAEAPGFAGKAARADVDAAASGGWSGTSAPAARGASAPASKKAESAPPPAAPAAKPDSTSGYADVTREEEQKVVATAEAESMNVARTQKRVLGNRNGDDEVDAATVARAEALSQQAWAAYREGDRAREAVLLRQALATGVKQAPLAPGLLNRLCDAEYALGQVAAAEAACDQVLREYPGTPAAHMARHRMQRERDAASRNVPAEAAGDAPSP